MTPDAARALAAHFQERCDQMGPDHPETQRLGRLVGAVLDLAAQVDALTADAAEGVAEDAAEAADDAVLMASRAKRKKKDA